MKTKRAFLSSPIRGLSRHREVVYRTIEGLGGYHCVRMEDFPPSKWDAASFCRARVAECDLFLGIVGPCLGTCPKDSYESYSEIEYDAAVERGIPRLMFVCSDDFPVPANEIESDSVRAKLKEFRQRVRSETVCGTFTSPDDLAASVRQAIHWWEAEHASNAASDPVADLAKRLGPYFDELDRRFAELGIDATSVPLDASTDEQDRVSLEAYVESWLTDEHRRHIALLGDYGTGKTWFCLALAKRLADAFRASPNSASLPLFVSFTRYRSNTDLLDLIRSELLETYGIELPSIASLVRLLRSSRTTLLLDGLDEMAKKQGHRSALLAFSRLDLPASGPKVLVTCRTHYFYSGSEQREVISDDEEALSIEKAPTFEVVHIRLLDPHKIVRCINKRFDTATRPAVMRFIKDTYNLSELCSRPVLLSLVCGSYELLGGVSGPVSSAGLYERYVRAWLKREVGSGRLDIEPDRVSAVVERLAYQMVKNDVLVLQPRELKVVLGELLDHIGIPLDRWPDLHRQLVTSTFIRRTSTDSWAFAHRSFQEFFYARGFFRWEKETGGQGEYPVRYAPIWRFVADLSLEQWNEGKARQWIPERVDRRHEYSLTQTTLRAAAAYWLLKRGTASARTHPLKGIMLDWVDLQGVDFSNCNLHRADFDRSDLQKASLRNAVLSNATCMLTNFDYASLVGVDAQETGFQMASFRSADLSMACLRGANLDSAVFTGAKLHGADFLNASVHGADFRGADFGRLGSDAWQKTVETIRTCRGTDNATIDDVVDRVVRA